MFDIRSLFCTSLLSTFVKCTTHTYTCKNDLKITKGLPEAVNRRTDNTMTKKIKDKRQWSAKHYKEN